MSTTIQAPARASAPTGQRLIDEITNDALRRAAMAPTYMDALDITGAALIAVAVVSRMDANRVRSN